MKFVLFDFDRTVTTIDTTLPFGVFVAAKCSMRHRIPLLVAALLLAKLRLVSNTGLKHLFARLLLRGQTCDRLHHLAMEFHESHLNALTDDRILHTLRTHVANGDRVFLVSANFDFFIKPLVERWSLAGMIATETEYRSKICTGRIAGTACHGHEKLRRCIVRCGAADLELAVSYGNQDDSPLLDAVHTGYLVGRAKPPLPFGLLRQYSHILRGKLNRTELNTAPRIDLFRSSHSPRISTTN